MTFHAPLAVVHKATANDYFRRAIDTPEYRDAVALRQHAIERRNNLPPVTSPPTSTRIDDLDAWLTAVANNRAADQEREAIDLALAEVINRSEAAIAAQVDVFPDRVLSALSIDLDDLMTEVAAAVTKLKGASTATEVITAGVGDTWNELTASRQEYDQIRDAQKFVMADEMSRHSSDYWAEDPLASRLVIRNIDDIYPSWKNGATNAFTVSGTAPDPRPWPLNDRTAQLVWLCTSDAEVWLPTFDDIEELQQELHRKRNPMPKVIPGRPDKASPKRTVARIG